MIYCMHIHEGSFMNDGFIFNLLRDKWTKHLDLKTQVKW